jgi:hypothetical protein
MTNETSATAAAAVSASPNTMRPGALERQSTVVQNAAAVTTDVTRRMICGGLAGMIAKVRQLLVLYSQCAVCKNRTSLYIYPSRDYADRYTLDNKLWYRSQVERLMIASICVLLFELSPSLLFYFNS